MIIIIQDIHTQHHFFTLHDYFDCFNFFLSLSTSLFHASTHSRSVFFSLLHNSSTATMISFSGVFKTLTEYSLSLEFKICANIYPTNDELISRINFLMWHYNVWIFSILIWMAFFMCVSWTVRTLKSNHQTKSVDYEIGVVFFVLLLSISSIDQMRLPSFMDFSLSFFSHWIQNKKKRRKKQEDQLY